MAHATVLLIEDDPDIASMLRHHAERAGFLLEHSASGEDGLAAMEVRSPKVVLLDVGLPGIDGVEVARTIRDRSDVPILMITARDSEVDTIVGLEVGADDYITKPFSPREVMARIDAVLRRTERAPERRTALVVGEHQIDADRREVIGPDGRVVRPTAREFDLVWFLAENAGLVLSRDQILDAVWGYDVLAQTRTVDAHIRQVRKKLPTLTIETVWGVGYRIEAT